MFPAFCNRLTSNIPQLQYMNKDTVSIGFCHPWLRSIHSLESSFGDSSQAVPSPEPILERSVPLEVYSSAKDNLESTDDSQCVGNHDIDGLKARDVWSDDCEASFNRYNERLAERGHSPIPPQYKKQVYRLLCRKDPLMEPPPDDECCNDDVLSVPILPMRVVAEIALKREEQECEEQHKAEGHENDNPELHPYCIQCKRRRAEIGEQWTISDTSKFTIREGRSMQHISCRHISPKLTASWIKHGGIKIERPLTPPPSSKNDLSSSFVHSAKRRKRMKAE